MRRIKINFLLAFIYNVIFIPVAAGFFIYFGLILQPWMSGACMAFSSISVSCSSLFLRRYKKPTRDSLETVDFLRFQERLNYYLNEDANNILNYVNSNEKEDLDQLSLHNAYNLHSSGKFDVDDIERPAAMLDHSSEDDNDDEEEEDTTEMVQIRQRTNDNSAIKSTSITTTTIDADVGFAKII